MFINWISRKIYVNSYDLLVICNSGEPQKKETEEVKGQMTDYDNLVEKFYKRLSEQRQYNQVCIVLCAIFVNRTFKIIYYNWLKL